jgi:hypothetical protein
MKTKKLSKAAHRKGREANSFYDNAPLPLGVDAAPTEHFSTDLRPLPTYIVKRNGDFQCKLREWNQCGPKGTSSFSYIITIEGKQLSGSKGTGGEKNFLIEHYELADKITAKFGKGKWAASCEAFAGSLVHIVHDIMGTNAKRVHVVIKPGALAEIQLEWKNFQQLPTLVAVKL